MSVRVIHGDCRTVLPTLAAESVHCCITSPPYWGLRDYQTGIWSGGDPTCDHQNSDYGKARGDGKWFDGGKPRELDAGRPMLGSTCGRCGAVRIDQQIGIEPTYQEHIATLVNVFREVRRVLRKDGTLWLNYGDCYATSVNGRSAADTKAAGNDDRTFRDKPFSTIGGALKPKDLAMMPARLALALQDDGWWIRSAIVWHKPNPMPESCRDRPTSSYEMVYLLTKRVTYFYDQEAIREDFADERNGASGARSLPYSKGSGRHDTLGTIDKHGLGVSPASGKRNARNVWTINLSPFSEAHFATFPPELVERCIKAGTSERGCCPSCGAQWGRVVERETRPNWQLEASRQKHDGTYYRPNIGGGVSNDARLRTDKGWQPTCDCPVQAPIPATVLDCFSGSGTTALVADRLGRNGIGIELNPQYNTMARNRVTGDCPLFAEVAAE